MDAEREVTFETFADGLELIARSLFLLMGYKPLNEYTQQFSNFVNMQSELGNLFVELQFARNKQHRENSWIK